MKQIRKRIVLLVLSVGAGSIPVFAKPFAVGLISDTRPRQWEAFGTFSADGKALCYNRR